MFFEEVFFISLVLNHSLHAIGAIKTLEVAFIGLRTVIVILAMFDSTGVGVIAKVVKNLNVPP